MRVWYTQRPCSGCSNTKPSVLVASTVRPWLTYTVVSRGRSRTCQLLGGCFMPNWPLRPLPGTFWARPGLGCAEFCFRDGIRVYVQFGNQALKFERIASCIARLVVVEINVDGAQLALFLNPLRPLPQRGAGVAALVLAAGTVQAHISEVGGDFQGRSETIQLKDAVSGVVAAQRGVDGFRVPAGLAEFKGVPVAARQRLQKCLQALHVHSPARRQLKEDGAQLFLQRLGARQEVLQRVFRLLELLVVSQEAAGFHREAEACRRCLAPGVEGRHTGQFVEAVIELHRIEVGKIKLEHFRGRELLGIERPAPVVVVPAGSANVDSGHITTPAERAGPTLRSCRTRRVRPES